MYVLLVVNTPRYFDIQAIYGCDRLTFSETEDDKEVTVEPHVIPNRGPYVYSQPKRYSFTYLLSTHADRQRVDISITVCNFVCLFVWLQISPPRIK